MPEKMSDEKLNVLRALGAEIIRTPTEAAWDAPESHISVARRLEKELPNAHILDQYANVANPEAHYYGTGEEILQQCPGITMFVAGAGTGGTISGTARKIKERKPNVKVIGVDPYGSILAQPESLNAGRNDSYQVEGIGYDFIPDVLDRSLVDSWIKAEDKPAFLMARRLLREEGLLCGGSSGTAVYAAVQAAKAAGLGKDDKVVVILPDSIRNYMTKHLKEEWMVAQGFAAGELAEQMEHDNAKFKGNCVKDLNLPAPITVDSTCSVKDAVSLLNKHGFDNLPVAVDGKMVGFVTLGLLSGKLSQGKLSGSDPVGNCCYRFGKKKRFQPITMETPLSALSRFFEKYSVAFVTDDKQQILGVVTKIDLVNYLVE